MKNGDAVYLLDIEIWWDRQARVWCGLSEAWLGLSLEAKTRDALIKEIHCAIPEMLSLRRRWAPFDVPNKPFDISLSLTEVVPCSI